MIMSPKSTTICVVDAAPGDYSSLCDAVPLHEGRMQFVPSGRAALRIDPKLDPDLWIINLRLPDMSGLDLYPMIRARFPDVPIYLVADEYSTSDEVLARSSGATMYFCKPLQGEWLFRRRGHEVPVTL
ncbi:MAG: response regulator [Planctomycetia bacterium]|nr:response regulator [Planctomycetia bacterium]